MSRRHPIGLWLASALAAAAAAAQTNDIPPPNPAEAVLHNAIQWSRDKARDADALAACQQVLQTTNAGWYRQMKACQIQLDVRTRQGVPERTIAAAEALRQAFGKNNPELDRRLVFAEADQYRLWKTNANRAIDLLRAYTERRPADREACAQAWLRIARFQVQAQQYDAADASARKALATDPSNAPLGADTLWLLQEIAMRRDRPEDRLQALGRSLAEPYADCVPEVALTQRRGLYVTTLRDLKRYDDARKFLDTLAKIDTDAARRQQWAFQVAETYAEQARLREALAAYERVFVEHPETSVKWPDTQGRIVDTLVNLGRMPDALRAAHVLYDAARGGAQEQAVQRILALLRTADGLKSERATTFQLWRHYGPAGRDGEIGTADDLTNVLAAIGYPEYAARHAACASAAPGLGDGTAASLQRGYGLLYAADPRGALTHFADALRRCPIGEAPEVIRVVLENGFRPLCTTPAEVEAAGRFILYGSAGPDGKPGTTDDLADPFAARGLRGPSAPGGAVPLSAAAVRDLRALAAELWPMIDSAEGSARQLAAIAAYTRVVEAQVVVNRTGELARVKDQMARERDPRVLAALAQLGATVAKADQLDLSGVRRFWAGLEQDYAARGEEMPRGLQGIQTQIDNLERSLTRPAYSGYRAGAKTPGVKTPGARPKPHANR